MSSEQKEVIKLAHQALVNVIANIQDMEERNQIRGLQRRCAVHPTSSTLKQSITTSAILARWPFKDHRCNLRSTVDSAGHLERTRKTQEGRTRGNHVRSCGRGPRRRWSRVAPERLDGRGSFLARRLDTYSQGVSR